MAENSNDSDDNDDIDDDYDDYYDYNSNNNDYYIEALLDAILRHASLAEIKAIVERSPFLVHESVIYNQERWLPVQLAVVMDLPLEVTRFLHGCNPRALRRTDGGGCTLLHHLGPTQRRLRVETLAFVLQEWPEALQQRNKEGELPIHRAVANCNVSVETVRCFLDHHPASIRERDNAGYVPLHAALHCRRDHLPPPQLIRLLVTRWPQSVHEWGGRDGDILPLMLAVHFRVSVEVVRILVEPWPEAVDERDSSGQTVLHAAITYGFLDVVRCLVEHRPQSLDARTARDGGLLPLHVAALHRNTVRGNDLGPQVERGCLPPPRASRCATAPSNVVRFLVDMRPQSVRERDGEGQLPLHSHLQAVRVSPDSVRIFLEAWPESILERDNRVQFPLHLAVARPVGPFGGSQQLDVVRVMVEPSRPEAALLAQDDQGQVPLHVSAKGGDRSLDATSLLLERCPASARAVDRQGRLPLHVALLAQDDRNASPSPALVDLLVAAFPGSVRVRDRQGMLPLHVEASRSEASPEVVQQLVEAWPESVLVREASGGLVPLLLAASSNASLDVLCYLARRSPEIFVRP